MKLKILIVLTLVLLAYGCGQKTPDTEQNAEQFIRYLAAHDIENAKTLASGSVLYNLSSKEKQDVPGAEITEISVQTLARSTGWAELQTTAKLRLANGDTDITWYRLDMSNSDGIWKVYQAELTGPIISGECDNNAKLEDMEAVKTVFNDYIQALAGDSQKSVKYLAGPARRTQEMALGTLGKAPLIKSIGEPTLTPVTWNKKDILVCRADYTVDGRDVKVVVTFAKFDKDIWKIAEVASL